MQYIITFYTYAVTCICFSRGLQEKKMIVVVTLGERNLREREIRKEGLQFYLFFILYFLVKLNFLLNACDIFMF